MNQLLSAGLLVKKLRLCLHKPEVNSCSTCTIIPWLFSINLMRFWIGQQRWFENIRVMGSNLPHEVIFRWVRYDLLVIEINRENSIYLFPSSLMMCKVFSQLQVWLRLVTREEELEVSFTIASDHRQTITHPHILNSGIRICFAV